MYCIISRTTKSDSISRSREIRNSRIRQRRRRRRGRSEEVTTIIIIVRTETRHGMKRTSWRRVKEEEEYTEMRRMRMWLKETSN